MKEEWYCWRELATVEGAEEQGPRLLVPMADPNEYEFPFDYLYRTKEEAVVARQEAIDEEQVSEEANEWKLVKMTLEVQEI